eukprot:COSAG06_NODE_31900_length_514_cov_0.874699_2_plen_56_part_01
MVGVSPCCGSEELVVLYLNARPGHTLGLSDAIGHLPVTARHTQHALPRAGGLPGSA